MDKVILMQASYLGKAEREREGGRESSVGRIIKNRSFSHTQISILRQKVGLFFFFFLTFVWAET